MADTLAGFGRLSTDLSKGANLGSQFEAYREIYSRYNAPQQAIDGLLQTARDGWDRDGWWLFWDEVHRSNMAKVGGPIRGDGKRLKPEGWTPPDVAGVLAAALLGETPE